MKKLIVSLLVVLVSTIVMAEEQDDAPPATPPANFDLSDFQGAANGPRLNLTVPETQYRPMTDAERYEADQRESLRIECQYRRNQDAANHGDSLVDRAIGNRVRDNLEQNRRDAMDGYGSVTRNDGSTFVYRRDRCADINGDYQTDDEREAHRPGFKPRINIDRHGGTIGGTYRF